MIEPDNMYEGYAYEFVQKHDLQAQGDLAIQARKVKEELKELDDALETVLGASQYNEDEWERLTEECVDVIFSIHVLSTLGRLPIRQEFGRKSEYNLQKSGERDSRGFITDDVED